MPTKNDICKEAMKQNEKTIQDFRKFRADENIRREIIKKEIVGIIIMAVGLFGLYISGYLLSTGYTHNAVSISTANASILGLNVTNLNSNSIYIIGSKFASPIIQTIISVLIFLLSMGVTIFGMCTVPDKLNKKKIRDKIYKENQIKIKTYE